jgi:hypothetical protein
MAGTGRRSGGIRSASAWAGVLLVAGALSAPALVEANGGTLRLANVRMGAYLVSAFTAPTPVRPDTLDVSVLVIEDGREGVPDDVRVTVRARALEGQGEDRTLSASRDQADDPRYYAAKFALGAEGPWELTVAVEGPGGAGEAAFRITARERGLLGHPLVIPLLALLPLAIAAAWILRTEEEDEEEPER